MCLLHRTHYPTCHSTITTSLTLCIDAKRREQCILADFVEGDIWCAKRSLESTVNRFEVCWKCAGGKAPPKTDASLRLANKMNIQRTKRRPRIYPGTERMETDDGFWDSDAETLHGDVTPPLGKDFALCSHPHMTHMRPRDVASMKRVKETTQWLRGMAMGLVRMTEMPNKVMMPKMDIVKMLRTPLRAPTVGRFQHLASEKDSVAAKRPLQNQVTVSPCREEALIEFQMEQRIPLSRAKTSLWRQGTILERGDDKSEGIRGRVRRRSGTLTAPQTPTIFIPPSTPRLPQTALFEGNTLELVKEWQEEDEKDKTKETLNLQQAERKMEVSGMQKNAETMQKNAEGTRENQKTAIKIGCPVLGYTKVMVENHEGEEKGLTVRQISEGRRETLRILEGKQDVAVADKMGPVVMRPMIFRPTVL